MANSLNVAASAMNAQMLRLNTVASNMANADTVAGSEAEAYRSRQPVFSTVLDQQRDVVGVAVTGVVESDAPVTKRYEPGHPQADGDGYIYSSNVNTMEEMANMMSASRSYQNNAEVFSTTKTLMLRALQLGQQ
ncbi:Flagellar basal-body rod protein FlgC [Zhongshania aliphaticivorans]|uniref:Flagellar basal-body rod protein FlgC n=1 Tax=Zhongshania aliphaticivorans TaxID=1470434 RepID=A0A5S9NLE9_9GAMM|nr:flagellar basal body rod protein FlgC [Zhongshania aliphaticivorans]CAA0091072.1 Flagellar basal-body rod protein FlgC [Zhongshania aliphaticivorans]CAA0098555.1 Flagellar basal-body rod protein FlgC [Zhongshania aliphaticivorans]